MFRKISFKVYFNEIRRQHTVNHWGSAFYYRYMITKGKQQKASNTICLTRSNKKT